MQADPGKNQPISDEIVIQMRAILNEENPKLWAEMTRVICSVDNISEEEFHRQMSSIINSMIVLIRNSGLVTSVWEEHELRLQLQDICDQESKSH